MGYRAKEVFFFGDYKHPHAKDLYSAAAKIAAREGIDVAILY